MALQSYRELEAWKKAMDFVEAIYELTRVFPDDEKFGLTSQLRRAAVSIPSNIAEGYGRTHRGDYLHHLSIAKGSLTEAETHLIIAVRLNFVTREEAKVCWELAQETGRLLNKLQSALKREYKSQTPNPEPRTLSPKPNELP